MKRTMLTLAVLLIAPLAMANGISVIGDAALTGSFGMAVDYTGATSLAYVQSADRGANPHPWNDETTINIAFTINPGMAGDVCYQSGGDCFGNVAPSLSVPGHNPPNQPGEMRIGALFSGWETNGVKIIMFLKRSTPDDAWRFSAWVRQDNDNNSGAFVFGGEGYLCGLGQTCVTEVELSWGAATGPGANDGYIRATRRQRLSGQAEQTIFERTDLDNDTHALNIFWLGSVDGSVSNELGNPEGNFYLDDVVITR
jgi:hypothetical protein